MPPNLLLYCFGKYSGGYLHEPRRPQMCVIKKMDDKDFFLQLDITKLGSSPSCCWCTQAMKDSHNFWKRMLWWRYPFVFFATNLFSAVLPFFLKRTHPSPYLTSICNVMRFTNLGDVLHMYSCLIDSVGLIDFEIWTIKVLGISKISSLLTTVYHMMHWEAATRNGLLLKFQLC
jgi:hypothetical protein